MKTLALLIFGTTISFSVYAEQQKITEGGQEADKSVTQRVYEGAREVIRESCDADCRARQREEAERQRRENNANSHGVRG